MARHHPGQLNPQRGHGRGPSQGRITYAALPPDPTVLLCTPCADIHIRVRTGRGLGLP